MKIEFYTLDFLSCWSTILHFLPSLFFPFFLRSSFSRSTNLNQTLRTNPFALHSPHQLDPNQTQNKSFHSSFSPSLCRLGLVRVIAWVQFELLPEAFFMVSIFHLRWVCVFVYLFCWICVYLFTSLWTCVFVLFARFVFLFSFAMVSLYKTWAKGSIYHIKLEPWRLDIAHQTQVS